MAAYYRVSPEEIRASLSQQGGENSVADRLRSRKSVEILVDKAKITDGEWIDEKAAQAAAEAETEAVVEEKPAKKKKAEKEEKSAEPKEKKARKKKED
ncbi:MAG TPA: hypothetical protein PKY82_24530, partial [Pyrinomonadaceae bacterium]|nr:hypothetical protein [Pyrinomonadaceae bacterium]